MMARKTDELLINQENICIQECEKPQLVYFETGEDDEMNSVWNFESYLTESKLDLKIASPCIIIQFK